MKRVRVCLGVVLACSLLDGGAALGQRAAEVQQSLDSTVKGQQLLIRDFVADRVIHYAWAVDHLEHQPTRMFTFGVFVADSIKVHESRGVADEVRIEGKRWVLRKVDPSAPDGLTDQSTKVIFDVDLRGADAATISGLKAVLFFPDVDAALGAVPPQFVRLIGLKKPGVNMSGGWKPGRWLKVEGKWQLVQGPVPNPRVRQTAEPQFSEEARSKKIGGNDGGCGMASATAGVRIGRKSNGGGIEVPDRSRVGGPAGGECPGRVGEFSDFLASGVAKSAKLGSG